MVLTQGLLRSPFSTAFFARSAAPIITLGFEVFVQDVIDAITTAPFETEVDFPSRVISTADFVVLSVKYVGRTFSNETLDSESWMRSCGRFGPAMEGTIVARSNSKVSEYLGALFGLCQIPMRFAYSSTRANCSALRPVKDR
ncbi:unannotated protein [freshwater metagenome]|uniref:Unannotated protein n=1 Tax=freshwater metagenome TaxID=449393 RepID=A0A6J6U9J0_9ZZZZ